MLVVTASSFAVARELPKNFALHDAPKPVAAIHFENGEGQPLNDSAAAPQSDEAGGLLLAFRWLKALFLK
jgi:hypothetical protein